MLPLVVFFKKFHQKVTQTIFTNEIKGIVAVSFKNYDLFPAGEQPFSVHQSEGKTSFIFLAEKQHECQFLRRSG